MAALIMGLYLGKLSLVAFPHYYEGWNKTWQPFLSSMFFAPSTKLFYFKPINDNISAKQVNSEKKKITLTVSLTILIDYVSIWGIFWV